MRTFLARNLLIMLIVLLERILTRGTVSDSNHHDFPSSSSSSSSSRSSSSNPHHDQQQQHEHHISAATFAALDLRGEVSTENCGYAAEDFGGIYHEAAAAVVKPACEEDIVKVLSMAAASDRLTVAARGNGHSISGQAQAHNGLVLDMTSVRGIQILGDGINGGGGGGGGHDGYADVGAGELWVDVLRACLTVGLTPRSWTDYLPLSVGGTLSNAGVSGQAFKFGPQISNVLQLRIVTGKGEAITCSPEQNEDIFYGALGGLGQFGIITEARIVLQKAPHMVRWMRFVYSDFEEFSGDQEKLILQENSFDYLEGFVLTNNADPVNGWPSVPFSSNSSSSSFDFHLIPKSAGPMLYCLEVALNYETPLDFVFLNKRIKKLVEPLRFIQGLDFSIDLTYFDFLNRVHESEMVARSVGTWHAPHPWLNIFVPRSRISEFDATVFRQILRSGVGGPILVYPMLKDKWDMRMSTVVPDEEMFYLVALLRFSHPYPKGPTVDSIQAQNQQILDFCKSAGINVKLYLPHYKTQAEWKSHFGSQWHRFLHGKALYDPSAILAPGQRIFSRSAVAAEVATASL